MTQRGIARRYATALYDVVRAGGDLARTREQLDAIAAMIAGHDELLRVIENPAIAASKKRAVIGAILDRAGGVMPELRRLLLMLAEHDRLSRVGDVATFFGERVMEASRVMPAEVVTAEPLTEQTRASLAAALGKATGSEVTIRERVDPAIVGGVVARVGSLVFDGSVSRQLERMRRRLLAEV